MTTSTPHSGPLEALPKLPRDKDGAVFRAPWEAQAFAMALKLHERGIFTWSEWAAALATELTAAAACGEPDDGTHYYEHWLAARNWWPQSAWFHGKSSTAAPASGTPPPAPRLTASRSSCRSDSHSFVTAAFARCRTPSEL
jgi:nitrile hydratase accessory protein